MKLLKKLCAIALSAALVAGAIGVAGLAKDTEVTADETSKIPFSGTLHIVGDSIADGYDNKNITDTDVVGWGNVIYKLFNENIVINNQANCGDSTNSFYYDYDNDGDADNKRYLAVYDNLKANDYVIISFGHNDWGRTVSKRGTVLGSSSTNGTFQWWLKEKFIDPVLDAGAVPILMNSVAYCRFENGVYTEFEKHLQYGQAVRDLVAEYKADGIDIIFIDALAYTGNAYSNMTEAEAKTYHATNDTCHYNEKGAMWISEFICAQMEANNMAISDYLLNPTVTETPSVTETPTPDPTETATPEPTETATPEPTETATPEPTETATPEPTETATPEPTETATPEPTESGKVELAGDVNLDGAVDATDALLVLKHAAKIEMLDDDSCIRAELDDNGSIDATDALTILKIAAKLL